MEAEELIKEILIPGKKLIAFKVRNTKRNKDIISASNNRQKAILKLKPENWSQRNLDKLNRSLTNPHPQRTNL